MSFMRAGFIMENCPDVRNTKIVDVIHAFQDYGIKVTTFDPGATPEELKHEYNIETSNTLPQRAIVLGVAHNEFLSLDLETLKKVQAVVYDVKGVLENTTGKL